MIEAAPHVREAGQLIAVAIFLLASCVAVESNPKTRAMYAEFGVRALPWDAFLLERAASA